MVASFLLAVQFLTRLPVPLRKAPTQSQLRWSTAFYPLVGILIGLGVAGSFRLISAAFPAEAAIVSALAFGVVVTGGLHEDGLADCADAFGAGGTKQRMLEIMRDSRIGTYGALSLILLFLFRFVLLSGLAAAAVESSLLLAHAGGRFSATLLARLFPAARGSGLGASFASKVGLAQILPGLLTLAGFGFWVSGNSFALLLLPGLGAALLFSIYCWRRVGGLSGDSLGAAVVIFEVGTYCAFAYQGAAS
ncbi:MAG: adenosylcobinamide-GDP ribazoletransferase [Acidobacteriota bacterium]